MRLLDPTTLYWKLTPGRGEVAKTIIKGWLCQTIVDVDVDVDEQIDAKTYTDRFMEETQAKIVSNNTNRDAVQNPQVN
ncbi:hypothetical protein JCM33374_g6593 [Metschnikowia sp. JCM 33374]|nr:hypothetical protein JCM33374_g6593 [Metschnikowia sp. JCM 33374]